MWSVLSQPAWVEPFSQIVTHTCLTFSLCWWTDCYHMQVSKTLAKEARVQVSTLGPDVDMCHHLINTWHSVSKHAPSTFPDLLGQLVVVPSGGGELKKSSKLLKAMWWDVVVVTCPKQSWVSSLREEVAIALNQVMMMIITIVGRVEFMNVIMMNHWWWGNTRFWPFQICYNPQWSIMIIIITLQNTSSQPSKTLKSSIMTFILSMNNDNLHL